MLYRFTALHFNNFFCWCREPLIYSTVMFRTSVFVRLICRYIYSSFLLYTLKRLSSLDSTFSCCFSSTTIFKVFLLLCSGSRDPNLGGLDKKIINATVLIVFVWTWTSEPLVISRNDKNKQLKLLNQCKLWH